MCAVIGWMMPWRSSAAMSSGEAEAMAACASVERRRRDDISQ